ncbi:hypothetical protein B0H67DRAFT_638492 [Lasiosphaeris hirsuta]|uniref:Uncharacterized protein n=1 Tax=Lasiosphaeris hirsuta TaxID=260670 RepID=A0AA40B976_9PEZI|nr:hypothetical protein B0H67DRAFT_638492 [Lasiosphaeris hirsuta]
MSLKTKKQPVYCVGSPTFDPEAAIVDDATYEAALRAHENNDFEAAIKTLFRIPQVRRLCTKTAPRNPYFDVWSWTAQTLRWTGPLPSHETLALLHLVAAGRAIADVGSGSGYWIFMLRQYASLSRNDGGCNLVLLLVYPIVGGGLAGGVDGGFTRALMAAYMGDTVAVVGTQNGNGYTGFRDMTMNQFIAKEHQGWVKVVQNTLAQFCRQGQSAVCVPEGERISPRAGK